MTSVRWILLTGLVMWVATCGQKGPLYLPEPAETLNLLIQATDMSVEASYARA